MTTSVDSIHKSGSGQQDSVTMAKITIRDREGKERVHELADAVTTIGRSSSCTVPVEDSKASRQHFRIERDGEFFKVVDLGSTNGTKLNGKKITSERLHPGDVVKLGKTTFRYEGPGEPRLGAPVLVEEDDDDDEADDLLGKPLDPPSEARRPDAGGHKGPKYVLVMIEGPETGKTYELGQEPMTIGRKSANTVKITDESASSYHAEIKKEPLGYVLADLGSTNGTKLRARGSDSYEKIVKTPLAAGSRIKIGKTVFEFRNIGAPSEDDDLLGTVVLDADKVEAKLEEKPGGAAARESEPAQIPNIAVWAAAMVIFIVVVFVVVQVVGDTGTHKPGGTKTDPVAPPDNQTAGPVKNPSFSDGTDDYGNPLHWKKFPGQPGLRIELSPDAEARPETPSELRRGLVIHKSGARFRSCRSTVETADSFPVTPGKLYEISGDLRNDGAGLYGLRVVWMRGSQQLEEHPLVLIGPQEWKHRTGRSQPPDWADRARVGVFTEGHEGKTYFDNLSFKEATQAPAEKRPEVAFQGVSLSYEGGKGAFSVKIAGNRALQDCALELIAQDGKALSTLVSALDTQLKWEGQKALFAGQLYDFALETPTNYLVEAGPGSSGLNIRLAVDRAQAASSLPRLQFVVLDPFGRGDLEAGTASGVQRLAAGAKADLREVEELTLNAGGREQVYLKFSPAVGIESSRQGNSRAVTVSFAGELNIQVAPENFGEKQLMAKKIAELEESLNQADWPAVWKQAESLDAQFGKRFPEAGERRASARRRMDEAWQGDQEKVRRQVEIMRQFKSYEEVMAELERIGKKWTGTRFVDEVQSARREVEAIRKEGVTEQQEKEAQKNLERARKNLEQGGDMLNIAKVLLNKILKDQANTSVRPEAERLLAQVNEALEKYNKVKAIHDKLTLKAKSYLLAADYAGAVKTVQSDKDYQEFKSELKELDALLQEWQKKAMGQ